MWNCRIWTLGVAIIAFFMVAGCGVIGGGYVNIGDLTANPSQYDGKEVRIKGKVTEVMKLPFLEPKLYAVKDETGEILVITRGTTPGMSKEIRVKGLLDTMAILGEKSVGLHLKESERW